MITISPLLIIFISLITEIVAFIICIFLAAAGDGTYLPAKILFPYTMISTYAYDTITERFIILALLQFPAYGVVLALARIKQRFELVGACLLVLHVSAIICSFAFSFSTRHFR